eukprot:CCRYP_004102-RA/>CCRYP_004102-RA protein AED:0.02 eAED:0.02 QI:0/0/0/1/1/1/2/0/848
MVTSILENTGLVCGSIRDTLSEKDVDMEWINHEFNNIKSTTKNMAASMAQGGLKACHVKNEKDVQSSPETVEGRMFFDDNSFVGESSVARSVPSEGGGEEDNDLGTASSTLITSDNSPKKSSRFAKVKAGKQRSNMGKDFDEGTVSSAPGLGQSTRNQGNTLVIGLCLSRRDTELGHPDTITRQTAFDFNELQDRDYKFVSSTDSSGWLAGGGEKGGGHTGVAKNHELENGTSLGFVHSDSNLGSKSYDSEGIGTAKHSSQKIAAPDKVHIPIIKINAESSAAVDEIISLLARGEVFIPHVSILPEALSVNGSSPPDLVVRFDCEKNDDANPEDWPNWCLEFLHNQLYDCFAPMGAQWTKRPFQITLARKVKWKTAKHMNKFFANAEQVINTWREKGPQYLQPPESTTFLGATQEEIARPHGIYLMRNGVPTNYFAPNFQPPYSTKVTRSLIRNVINKSWDSKRRDWLSEPVPRMRGPVRFISTVLGCAHADAGTLSPVESNAVFDLTHDLESFDFVHDNHRKAKAQIPGRRVRKETIESNPPDSLLTLAYSPRVPPKEHVITATDPSDESLATSPKPFGAPSMDETTSDSITAVPTQSSVESLGTSTRQSPKEEHVEQQLFSPMITPQRRSPKRTPIPQRQDIKREKERNREDGEEANRYGNLQKKNPSTKVVDSKAEKFAKTKSKRREMRDRRQDENTPISPRISDTGWQHSHPLSSPSCESTTMSLAYSLEDSTTFFRGPATPPTTFNHNDGGSVLTMGTENQSLLSYVTRSTMVQSRMEAEGNNDDADDISLSLLESKSSIVPTDDELMAIGWAKALDPNSGLYYYFTLDRSKTVWENPLSTSP